MSRIVIQIDGKALDVYSNLDNLFYITNQVFDLRSLQERKAGFTRTFSIPATANNLTLLDRQSNEQLGNKSTDSVLLLDGITFSFSKLFVISNTRYELEIVLLYGNFDFFDNIPNESIKELDFSAYDIAWTEAILATKTVTTEGLIIAYSRFIEDETFNDGVGNIFELTSYIDIINFGFFFYAKTILKAIAENAGYIFDESSMVTDDNYSNLVLGAAVNVPYSTPPISGRWAFNAVFTYYGDANLGLPLRMPFDNLITDSTSMWDNTNKEYIIATAGNYKATIDFTFDYTEGAGGLAVITIFKNGSEETSYIYPSTNATGFSDSFNAVIACSVGDVIHAEVEAPYTNPSKWDQIDFYTSTYFDLTENVVDPTGNMVVSDWLPDISQKQFFTDILSCFNAFVDANPFTKEVSLKKWNDFIIEAPQDLSNNYDTSQEVVNEISVSTYFRKSLMAYNNDDIERTDCEYIAEFTNDESLQEYGTILTLESFSGSDKATKSGTLDIPSTSIQYRTASGFSITVGTSLFSFANDVDINPGDYIMYNVASDKRVDRVQFITSKKSGQLYNNYHVGLSNVDVYIITYNHNSITPRLCLLDPGSVTPSRPLTTNGSNQYISNTPVDLYTVNILTMNTIHDEYYKNLFDALQTPKLLQVWMVFNTVEFYNIDLLKPITIKGFNGSFYINKIEQWKLNQPCLVELIRINPLI